MAFRPKILMVEEPRSTHILDRPPSMRQLGISSPALNRKGSMAATMQSLFTSGLGPGAKARGFSKPVEELVAEEKHPGEPMGGRKAALRAAIATPARAGGEVAPTERRRLLSLDADLAGSEPLNPSRSKRSIMSCGGRSFRTNHLGQPTQQSQSKSKSKIRYARSYTILLHRDKGGHMEDEALLSKSHLVQQAQKTIDLSLEGLRKLHDSFEEISTSCDERKGAVGPRRFWTVMSSLGMRDPVLVQRIFTAFMREGVREDAACLDCRDFILTLAQASPEPIEAKVSLVFRLYDVDHSNTISLHELTQIFVRGQPTTTQQKTVGRIERLWHEIHASSEQPEGDWWTAGLAPSEQGLRCEDLLTACRRSSKVRELFRSVLSRDQPAAAPLAASPQPFAQRMAELQGMEVRHATQQRIDALRPRTVDGTAHGTADGTVHGTIGPPVIISSPAIGSGGGGSSLAGSRPSRSQGSPSAALGPFERHGTPSGFSSVSSTGSLRERHGAAAATYGGGAAGGRLPRMGRATSSGTLPQLQAGGLRDEHAGRKPVTLADQALTRYQPSSGNILGAAAIEAHLRRRAQSVVGACAGW